MAKMTMHKELEMLREEVLELKKQKLEHEKLEKAKAAEAKKIANAEQKEVETKAEEIMHTIEEGKVDAKETLDQLLTTIKDDYKNLSPTSAIVLFALGAAFGNALSSK